MKYNVNGDKPFFDMIPFEEIEKEITEYNTFISVVVNDLKFDPKYEDYSFKYDTIDELKENIVNDIKENYDFDEVVEIIISSAFYDEDDDTYNEDRSWHFMFDDNGTLE